MDQLAKNILWRFKYYFVVVAFVIAVAVCALVVRQANERQKKLQREESDRTVQKQAEQLRLGIEESNRLTETKAEQDRALREENNRLAKIQEIERQKERQKQAQEKLTADLKAYKTRYLGNPNTRYSIAILVANETGQPNAPLGHALGTLLNTNGLTTTASLFTPEFISDGRFKETMAGSKEAFDKLELANFVQAVLLAHQSVQYSTNSTLEGLITATMTFDANTFSTKAFQSLFADSIKVVGAGFNRLEARTMAEERVLKQFKDGRLGSVQKAVLAEGK